MEVTTELIFVLNNIAYVKNISYPSKSLKYIECQKKMEEIEKKNYVIKNFYSLSNEELENLSIDIKNSLNKLIKNNLLHIRLLIPETRVSEIIDNNGNFYDKRFIILDKNDRLTVNSLFDYPIFIPDEKDIYSEEYKGSKFIYTTKVMDENENVGGYSISVAMNPLGLSKDDIDKFFVFNYFDLGINTEYINNQSYKVTAIMDSLKYANLSEALKFSDKQLLQKVLKEYKQDYLRVIRGYTFYRQILKLIQEKLNVKSR